MAHQCDVTSWDDQVSLFKAGYEKYGRIDYVIANAGVCPFRELYEWNSDLSEQESVTEVMVLWLCLVPNEIYPQGPPHPLSM